MDACNNVYVGSTNAIYKFDANLALLGSVATTGAIYDLKIPAAGTLLAGGNALVISNTSLSPCAPNPISCVILPATLSYLQGECESGNMALEWVTEKEIEMSHFDVERSLDGNNWTALAKVVAAGNSDIIQSYRWAESAPLSLPNGFCHYRLKMVDRNGESQYSGITTIEDCGSVGPSVKVNPTVTANETELEFSAVKADKGELKVLNLEGKNVKTLKVSWNSGENRIPLSLRELPAGTYLITVSNEEGTQIVRNARVVKQ